MAGAKTAPFKHLTKHLFKIVAKAAANAAHNIIANVQEHKYAVCYPRAFSYVDGELNWNLRNSANIYSFCVSVRVDTDACGLAMRRQNK